MRRIRKHLPLCLVLLGVTAIYANHFRNGFHFDDSHTVVDNPYIRSLANLPRFFTDTTTFSVLPANRTYRPMVSASLALDYALGHGYKPFWFHFSTFLIFLAQLIFMYLLFGQVMDAARPDRQSTNRVIAVLAVAWYGLHPAISETVNYIIQRGDIFSTCGVIAALAIYARWPRLRRTGIYLLPFLFAMLSKPPAAVFPLLLFVYLLLFEPAEKRRYARAAFASIPALIACVLMIALQAAMTPKSYTPSILSASAYRLTQPLVLLRYFAALILPIHLNVDTDLPAYSTVTAGVALGMLFVVVLLVCAWLALRRPAARPIAFGLLWFLIASLPTSLYPLSEVENDHRMFFPFVGLILAIVWALALALEKVNSFSGNPRTVRRLTLGASVVLLCCYAYGTYLRNQVWRNDESLWLDDVQKCPHNGRGLMNYGLTQMAKGAYPFALDYFQRALAYTPNYPTLEVNLGIAYGATHQPVQAVQHFVRALQLDPHNDEAHFYYGRWLYQSGALNAAIEQLQQAVALNPSRVAPRDLLAEAFGVDGDEAQAQAEARDTLRIAPGDSEAERILAEANSDAAAYWIEASLYRYQSGNYDACIAAAQQALKVKPDSELAYNNLGAAYAALQQWDLAIASERQALKIKPEFTLAKNNLALYTRLSAAKNRQPASMTAEDWVNASLSDYKAGNYHKSIQDAQHALRLHPDYAEAYNNIAAAYASLHQWDQAIAAAQAAVRIKPDFQLAKNNLAWAVSQKTLAAH